MQVPDKYSNQAPRMNFLQIKYETPSLISEIQNTLFNFYIETIGEIIVVSAEAGGIFMANISDPFNPRIISTFQYNEGYTYKTQFYNNCLYVADDKDGLFIFEGFRAQFLGCGL